MTLPALPPSLAEIVEEYESKVAALDTHLSTFSGAVKALETACCIGGTFVGSIWPRYTPSAEKATCESMLLKSAWRHVIKGLQIEERATAKDLDKLRLAMENPPPLTLDTICATFATYLVNPRQHMLRGVAEAFCELDPAFRSHSKMKIGVAGLPKRIIVKWAIGDYGFGGQGWREGQLRNILDALAALNGQPKMTWDEFADLGKRAKAGDDPQFLGLTVRAFGNGNVHLIFDPESLRQINLALAEFYGDTLPDLAAEPGKMQPGTAVSADLAYYPTPAAVCNELLRSVHIPEGAWILEPSCGDGRILDALRDYVRKAFRYRATPPQAVGIEVHPGRADQAKAKGHSVLCTNFLDVAPDARFDLVLMNPPFAGKHYAKHIHHAVRFLKPGGMVAAVLPLTAWEDHGLLPPGGRWEHLPVASFAEAGTNVSTGIWRYVVKA